MIGEIYRAEEPFAALVLAHGAGAGQHSAWMVKAARALAERGVSVATFDFPYITAGRKVPDRAPALEAHWRALLDEAKTTFKGLPLFIGGKSMGGRIASHIASQGVNGVSGLVFFGYPLHPPRVRADASARQALPEKRRDAHLPAIKEPMLFIQGSLDTFGDEEEMTALMPMLQNATLHVIPGGDHSFKVKGALRLRSGQGVNAAEAVFESVITTAVEWMRART